MNNNDAVILHFRHHFHKGTLSGLTHDDHMSFVSEARAREWVASINSYKALDYTVTILSIETVQS